MLRSAVVMPRSADSASLAVLYRAIVVKPVITLLTAGGSHVPGGSVSTAAIYTESVKVTHIIRKAMLRMDAWLDYLFPY